MNTNNNLLRDTCVSHTLIQPTLARGHDCSLSSEPVKRDFSLALIARAYTVRDYIYTVSVFEEINSGLGNAYVGLDANDSHLVWIWSDLRKCLTKLGYHHRKRRLVDRVREVINNLRTDWPQSRCRLGCGKRRYLKNLASPQELLRRCNPRLRINLISQPSWCGKELTHDYTHELQA